MSDPLIAVLVALIGALGLILVAIVPLLYSTHRHAKEANEAVNCKPKNQPRISEVVDTIAEEVSGLARSQSKIQSEVREIRREQAAVARALGDHLAHGE